MNEKLALFVVSHKKLDPSNYPGRKIIYVGKNCFEIDNKTIFNDKVGINISEKNPMYCELTALYWVWKNYQNYEYVGFEHYRRLFSKSKKSNIPYSTEELYKLIQTCDFIIPHKERHFLKYKYFYAWNFGFNLDFYNSLKKTISESNNVYLNDYEKLMNSHVGNLKNMFICSKDNFNKYMGYLFSILKQGENHINELKKNHRKRLIGFYSELLINPYLNYNHLKYIEIPFYFNKKI